MNDDINIQRGFLDALFVSAAELYDAAFGANLSISIPNYGVPTLQKPAGPIHFCGGYTNIPFLDSAVSSGLRGAQVVKESLLVSGSRMAENL